MLLFRRLMTYKLPLIELSTSWLGDGAVRHQVEAAHAKGSRLSRGDPCVVGRSSRKLITRVEVMQRVGSTLKI